MRSNFLLTLVIAVHTLAYAQDVDVGYTFFDNTSTCDLSEPGAGSGSRRGAVSCKPVRANNTLSVRLDYADSSYPLCMGAPPGPVSLFRYF